MWDRNKRIDKVFGSGETDKLQEQKTKNAATSCPQAKETREVCFLISSL